MSRLFLWRFFSLEGCHSLANVIAVAGGGGVQADWHVAPRIPHQLQERYRHHQQHSQQHQQTGEAVLLYLSLSLLSYHRAVLFLFLFLVLVLVFNLVLALIMSLVSVLNPDYLEWRGRVSWYRVWPLLVSAITTVPVLVLIFGVVTVVHRKIHS